MTVSALITEGIGPQGTVPLLLTGGLYQGDPAPPAVTTGGHFLPFTKRQLKDMRRKARAENERREQFWIDARRDQEEIRASIMATLHPERDIGIAVTQPVISAISDEDEDDLEVIIINA